MLQKSLYTVKPPLIAYVERGNLEGIRVALAYDVLVNNRYHYSQHVYLTGRNLTDSPENGYTALHFLMISNASAYQGEEGKKNRLAIAQALLDNDADANLRADNGDTAYALALTHGHNVIAEMLKTRGVDTRTEKTVFEKCRARQFTVVAVVKGFKEGKEVVIMGKKMGDDGKLKQQYLMPGGFEDPEDKSPITAALRELQEEVGLNLTTLIESGAVKPEVFYSYEGLGESGKKHYRTSYVLIDLGRHLEAMKLRARDDFHAVAAIPLDSIVMRPDLSIDKHYTTTRGDAPCPMRPSNGRIIEALKVGITADMKSALDALSESEVDGEYQLLNAAVAGDFDKLRYLLAIGVPANPVDYLKDAAVNEAAARGRLDSVKVLVEAGAVLNRGGFAGGPPRQSYYGPLSAAVSSANNDLFDYLLALTLQLLNRSVGVDWEEDTHLTQPIDILKDALEYAAQEGNLYAVSRILATGLLTANDKNRRPPLVHATKAGHKEMVEYLLSQGANVNIDCDYDPEVSRCGTMRPSPILTAIEAGHPDIALLLLQQAEVDVNQHRFTYDQELWEIVSNPLFAAIHFGHSELAFWILEHTTIELNTCGKKFRGYRDEKNRTAFEFAIEKGQHQLAAAIAKKMIIQKIAEQLGVETSHIESKVQADEHGKTSFHIIMSSRERIEALGSTLAEPVKQDLSTGKFYIRLGEVRLGMLMENGKALYSSIAAAEKSTSERRTDEGLTAAAVTAPTCVAR